MKLAFLIILSVAGLTTSAYVLGSIHGEEQAGSRAHVIEKQRDELEALLRKTVKNLNQGTDTNLRLVDSLKRTTGSLEKCLDGWKR